MDIKREKLEFWEENFTNPATNSFYTNFIKVGSCAFFIELALSNYSVSQSTGFFPPKASQNLTSNSYEKGQYFNPEASFTQSCSPK